MALLRLVRRLLCLPIDLLRLTADACRVLALKLSGPPHPSQPNTHPFGCGVWGGKGGAPICVAASRYANVFIFWLLCPKARAGAGEEAALCGDAAFQPRLARALGVIAATFALWAAVVVAAGAGLARLIPHEDLPEARAPATPAKPAAALSSQATVEVSDEAKSRARDYVASAERFAQAGRHAEALIEFRNAAREDPTNASAQLGIGRSCIATGDPLMALNAFAEAVRLDPRSLPARLELASAALERNDSALAETHALEARGLAPEDPAPRLLLSRVYRARRDFEAAAKEINEAFRLAPENVEICLSAGDLSLLREDYPAAERWFRRALDISKDSLRAMLGLAKTLRAQGRLGPAAEIAAAALRKSPGDTEAEIEQAEQLVAAGKMDEAVMAYLKIVEKRPKLVLCRARLAELVLRSGRVNDAYLLALGVLADEPGFPPAHMVLAHLFYSLGLYDIAGEHCARALIKDQNNVSAYALHARVLLAKGQY
ncbi:MAG TPA: tetratricopeptide repeat protein, partial [Candidatus Brocadiia bacterium]|nr:tetratricopeptide repeat protein [Candidatus Brocadiia bacterium]